MWTYWQLIPKISVLLKINVHGQVWIDIKVGLSWSETHPGNVVVDGISSGSLYSGTLICLGDKPASIWATVKSKFKLLGFLKIFTANDFLYARTLFTHYSVKLRFANCTEYKVLENKNLLIKINFLISNSPKSCAAINTKSYSCRNKIKSKWSTVWIYHTSYILKFHLYRMLRMSYLGSDKLPWGS